MLKEKSFFLKCPSGFVIAPEEYSNNDTSHPNYNSF
jgi:hypothetical protein